jgi:hypothetical protein
MSIGGFFGGGFFFCCRSRGTADAGGFSFRSCGFPFLSFHSNCGIGKGNSPSNGKMTGLSAPIAVPRFPLSSDSGPFNRVAKGIDSEGVLESLN